MPRGLAASPEAREVRRFLVSSGFPPVHPRLCGRGPSPLRACPVMAAPPSLPPTRRALRGHRDPAAWLGPETAPNGLASPRGPRQPAKPPRGATGTPLGPVAPQRVPLRPAPGPVRRLAGAAEPPSPPPSPMVSPRVSPRCLLGGPPPPNSVPQRQWSIPFPRPLVGPLHPPLLRVPRCPRALPGPTQVLPPRRRFPAPLHDLAI